MELNKSLRAYFTRSVSALCTMAAEWVGPLWAAVRLSRVRMAESVQTKDCWWDVGNAYASLPWYQKSSFRSPGRAITRELSMHAHRPHTPKLSYTAASLCSLPVCLLMLAVHVLTHAHLFADSAHLLDSRRAGRTKLNESVIGESCHCTLHAGSDS
eukprot:3044840-Pleurochrysis_carterae.AAC.2